MIHQLRSAIELLVSEGDFTTDVDATVIDASGQFQLVVDWEDFGRRRISIRRG